MSQPVFVAPGPSFDAAGCMKDKSILSIPVLSANPFTANIEKAMQGVAAKVGFKFTTWENQGQSSQWTQGMDTALNQKVSLIDLLAGTDPRVLVPQIAAARAARDFRYRLALQRRRANEDRRGLRRRRCSHRLFQSGRDAGRLGDRQDQGQAQRAHADRDRRALDRLDDGGNQRGIQTLSGLQTESDELSRDRLGDAHHPGRAGRAARRSHGQLHHRHLRQHGAVRHSQRSRSPARRIA